MVGGDWDIYPRPPIKITLIQRFQADLATNAIQALLSVHVPAREARVLNSRDICSLRL